MVDIGVLKELLWHNNSPWVSASFGVPKKTGNIQVVTDFRELNKFVEVDQFPLPHTNQMLQKLERFKSTMALD